MLVLECVSVFVCLYLYAREFFFAHCSHWPCNVMCTVTLALCSKISLDNEFRKGGK